MADIAAARAEVQKVVAFLVPRFSPREDVFKYLTLALANLEDEKVEEPPVVAAPPEPVIVEPAAEEETTTETDTVPMFPPRSRGRRSKRI